MDIREILRTEIARYQAALDALDSKDNVIVKSTAQNTTRSNKPGKKVLSPATKAKMSISSQARYARERAAKEAAKQQAEQSVIASTPPPAEPATVGSTAKTKNSKTTAQPNVASATQSIMPAQPNQ